MDLAVFGGVVELIPEVTTCVVIRSMKGVCLYLAVAMATVDELYARVGVPAGIQTKLRELGVTHVAILEHLWPTDAALETAIPKLLPDLAADEAVSSVGAASLRALRASCLKKVPVFL